MAKEHLEAVSAGKEPKTPQPKKKKDSGVKEFTGMFSAFCRLADMMTKLNDLLEGIGKCKKCGKGSSIGMNDYIVGKFDKEPDNVETLKKVLCKKHRRMFEELEELAKVED